MREDKTGKAFNSHTDFWSEWILVTHCIMC